VPRIKMLLLGHMGITLGAAATAEATRLRLSRRRARLETGRVSLREPLVSLSHRIDLRVLLVGSLLPDMIDKPLGLVLLPTVFGGGRLYAHTLLFAFALAIAGLIARSLSGKTTLLVLAYGSAMHLVLDGMWRTPDVLLWPALGPMPASHAAQGWLMRLLAGLTQNPAAYSSEIAGAIMLAPLIVVVIRRREIGRFLRTGVVD